MKVKIGPYVPHVGPYQIAEKLVFWDNEKFSDRDTLADKLGEKLSNLEWLNRLCSWVYSKRSRTVKVRVDNWDTWNADHTLALIILPVLKNIKEGKHGAPNVDDDDVPEELRSTSAPEQTEEEKNCGHTDDNWFRRWDYVVDEMIWAFEQHADPDWESQFYSGKVDTDFVKVEGTDYSEMRYGPNHTFEVDREGMNKHRERMSNGRRLFAKYYESLWR